MDSDPRVAAFLGTRKPRVLRAGLSVHHQNLMYVMLAIGFAELWTRWPVIGISITRKRRKPRRASETA